MDKYKVMENVANGLLAASMIKKMYAPVSGNLLHAERGQEVNLQTRPHPDKVMEVIANYSPKEYRSSLTNTVRKCSEYTNSYRSLKRNITLSKTRGVNSDAIADVLAAMSPVVDNRGKVLISKVLKIYEILKS